MQAVLVSTEVLIVMQVVTVALLLKVDNFLRLLAMRWTEDADLPIANVKFWLLQWIPTRQIANLFNVVAKHNYGKE